jgi:hypothetical protein
MDVLDPPPGGAKRAALERKHPADPEGEASSAPAAKKRSRPRKTATTPAQAPDEALLEDVASSSLLRRTSATPPKRPIQQTSVSRSGMTVIPSDSEDDVDLTRPPPRTFNPPARYFSGGGDHFTPRPHGAGFDGPFSPRSGPNAHRPSGIDVGIPQNVAELEESQLQEAMRNSLEGPQLNSSKTI